MNIGFISTRLAGTDGVSLETAKWATVLRRMGHQVFYCAGELDPDGPPGRLTPEMHFDHPLAKALGGRAFGSTAPDPTLLYDIATAAAPLRLRLLDFISEFHIDLLIPQNIMAIPMQLPLGQAVGQVVEETGLPTIAHNHDFYWERERFRVNCIPKFLDTYFPFSAPNLRHAVINSLAKRNLKARRGLDATVVPNVFDFAPSAVKGRPGTDDFNADLRESIGLDDDDLFILQPTRVVARKGIELSIELLRRLDDPRCKLIITHHAGDEGLDYLHKLQAMADEAGVDLRYEAHRFDPTRRTELDGRKVYALWDAYVHADLVTYPSLIEGFGNALIEAVYFRCPTLVNRYPVYAADIGPLGFDFVEIGGKITDKDVAQVRDLLADSARRKHMTEHNYRLGQEHFSFERLEKLLRGLMENTVRL